MSGPTRLFGFWVGTPAAPDRSDAYGVVVERWRTPDGQEGEHRTDYRLLADVLRDPRRPKIAVGDTSPVPSTAPTLSIIPRRAQLVTTETIAIPRDTLHELFRLAELGAAEEGERALFARDALLDARVTRARQALLTVSRLLETPQPSEATG